MSEAELLAQIAELKDRIAKLEERGKPAAPMRADATPFRDLTANATMPPSALRIMADAVPDHIVRQITNGLRVKGELSPIAGAGRVDSRVPYENRSGWRAPAPLSNPPGVALADRIVDAQDARDRAELIEREAKRLEQTKTDNAA
jgi:hypothetical protein